MKQYILLGITIVLLSGCGGLYRKAAEQAKDPVGRNYISKNENTTVTKLKGKVNTDEIETSPIVSPDGQTLLFNRVILPSIGFPTCDIFESRLENGQWGKPKKLGNPPNIAGQNFLGSFTADGQLLAFASQNSFGVSSSDSKNSTKIAEVNPKIFIAKKVNGKFEIIEKYDPFKGRKTCPMPILNGEPRVYDEVSYSNPCISPDGNTLFFSANLEGSFGGYDLFYTSRKPDGTWNDPQNMGDLVNSVGDDISPYIHPDNQTLYFTSNGHPGLGKSDIYMTVLENGKWNKPILLGEPISSPFLEAGFSVSADGSKAYFASSRNNKDILDADIYETDLPAEYLPKSIVQFEGTVIDGSTNKPIEASISVEDLKLQKKLYDMQSDFESGRFFFTGGKGKDYSVSVSKQGYTFSSFNIDIPKNFNNKLISKNVIIFPIKSGTKLTLNNIFFETGSDKLNKDSQMELDRVYQLLMSSDKFDIEIGGHTDNVGSDKNNQVLSEKRAAAVKNYLIKKGLSSKRVSSVGYGESQPISDNETEEGKQQNRRVEVVFK